MREILFIAIFSSFLAHAENALISRVIRNNDSGLYANRVEICQIFPTYIYISHGYADNFTGYTTSESRPLSVSGEVSALIASAANAPINSTNNPVCGGETTEIKASKNASLDTLLFNTGGCGFPLQKRSGDQSKILLDMVADNCPKH